MSYADVCEAVESLQRKYCERDPFRLCADMGIKLLYQPLGTDPDAIKGFYLEASGYARLPSTATCRSLSKGLSFRMSWGTQYFIANRASRHFTI